MANKKHFSNKTNVGERGCLKTDKIFEINPMKTGNGSVCLKYYMK